MSGTTKSEPCPSVRLLQAGANLGSSPWLTVDAEMNRAFAEITRDRGAMQIDGRSQAHGFLTLSLLSTLLASALQVESAGSAFGEGYVLNYGFNGVRLIEPIPLGARVRGHFRTVARGAEQRHSVIVIPIEVTVEIENVERPALAGEWLVAWKK